MKQYAFSWTLKYSENDKMKPRRQVDTAIII